jgi:hypothetical protein
MRLKTIAVVAVMLSAGAGLASAEVTGDITGSNPSPLEFLNLPFNANVNGTVDSTVTITDAGAGGVADVFFMTDTTGSMGGFIGSIQSVFTTVLTDLNDAGIADFRWAVGDYKDFEDGGPYVNGINVGQNFTDNVADAQLAIDGYFASGGGDLPEQNLAALELMGDGWVSNYGGRDEAQKIVVWGGDVEGWEDGAKGFPYPTLGNTVDALVDRGAQVFAINPFGAGFGIDAEGTPSGENQASAITGATGGTLFNNVTFGDEDAIADLIEDAITTGVETVGSISLTVEGDVGDWIVDVVNSPVVGPFGSDDSPIDTIWDLDITAPGYEDARSVVLALRADGAILDTIDLNLSTIPAPSSVLLLGLGGAALRRRR